MHPKLSRNQLLESRAHALRGSLTRSEEALAADFLGKTGRFSPPSGNFIADFAVPARRLAIEVDGPCHRDRKARDARKDRALARLGWRVLRLDAELVLRAPQEALARVREALAG